MPTKRPSHTPLRIGVNARWLIPGRMEGTGWYTRRILEQLVADHPEVEWHLFFDRSHRADLSLGDAQQHVLGPPARHPWLWAFWNEVRIPQALKRLDISVYWSPDGLLPKRLRGWHGRLVTTIHDLNFVHQPEGIPERVGAYYRRVIAHSAQQADALLTVSNQTKLDVISTYSIPPERIAVSYNAPAQAFRPFDATEKSAAQARFAGGHPYFCFVGAFTPRKNVRTLVEAFVAFRSKYPDLPHHLVLVGSALHHDDALDRSLAQGGKRIHVLGHVEGATLQEVYGGATAFCFPSRFEGFGIPLIEAMASGCPVISSSASCMPEIVGDAGVLLSPDDPDAWATAMGDMAQNDAHDWIQKGLVRAGDFQWSRSAAVVWKALQPC